MFFKENWFLLGRMTSFNWIPRSIRGIGDFFLFLKETFRALKNLWVRRGLFLKYCEFIGVSSLAIILFSAVFMGAVLGYQLYVGFHVFGAEALLGASVGVALFRDLAPVFAAIMVTGRAGAAMAAELATMRITEQIDALEVMAIDPYAYLVSPRVSAGFLMMPLLSVVFAVIASLSSAFIACGVMGLSYATFWDQFAKYVDSMDLIHCTTKGAVFGFLIASIGCYYGFRAKGGASAVGHATRATVVATCLAILLSDYIVTSLLPFGFDYLILE